jgi:hypothetical protein
MIWKEPISKVAPRFNISNVALAKICRKHGIPRPPHGYWAKLTADKPVTRIALPRRGLGMPQHIELDNKNRWHYSRPTDPDQVEILPPAEFQETQDNLELRVRKLVGKVTVPRDLSRAHHSIRKLLEKGDERREAQNRRPYHSSFDTPLFDAPYERRRLRLISAIFLGLERNVVKVTLRGRDPNYFGFTVGEQCLSFSLDHPDVERHGWRWGNEANRPTSLLMHLEVHWWEAPAEFKLSWKDEPGKKLERQLKEVVVALIVAGEMWYRLSEVNNRERQIELKDCLTKEAIQRAEKEK